MAKFKCKDMGMKCDFEVKNAGSREEVAEMAQIHARRTHNVTSMTSDMQSKMQSAIKD